MSLHLSDMTRKKIIADKISGMSYRAVAQKYGISKYHVERVVKSDPAFSQKVEEKKEQNTLEMLAYFDGQKGKAQELLTSIIEALGDPEKLAKANVRDLATAYGIIADKFIATSPKTGEDVLQKAREILGSYHGAIS